jgi:mannose-6-phosphate isomerase-like protein (cupin superfamily)
MAVRCLVFRAFPGGGQVTGIPAFSVQAGEGRTLPTPTADLVTIKADTRQTNGSMTVMEFRVAPGSGPATHIHLREDELWWVLEGDFRFRTGDDWLQASTGGMAFGPRGMPHAFQNIGTTPGRLLIVTTPSGLERFFEQFAESGTPPVGFGQLTAVGEANWLEFTGPPLGETDPV